MFIIFCSVTARTEKNEISGYTGHNSLIQTVKRSLFKVKKIKLSKKIVFLKVFITRRSHPKDTSAKKSFVFNHAPSWNDCEMFIVFCSVTARTELEIFLGTK